MVNYTLKVYYPELKMSSEVNWKSLMQSDDINPYALENLDAFTTVYKDKEELIKTLELFKLVSRTDKSKNLSIRYNHNKLNKEARMLFNESLNFFDVNYLVHYVSMQNNNLHFLKCLCNVYKKNVVQNDNISIIKNYIANKECNMPYASDDEEYIYLILKDFVYKQIYKYDYKNDCYMEDEFDNYLLIYKQFHDLIVFISSYSRHYDSKDEIDEINKCYNSKITHLHYKRKERKIN